MKRQMIGSFVVVMLVVAIAPFVVGAASGTPSSSPVASPAASPAASPGASPVASPAAAEMTVHIKDFLFDPATITVAPGTKVTWINDGPTIHTTTSTAKPPVWDSGLMKAGDTYSYTFTKAGDYDYLCTLHPQMLGKVIVKP